MVKLFLILSFLMGCASIKQLSENLHRSRMNYFKKRCMARLKISGYDKKAPKKLLFKCINEMESNFQNRMDSQDVNVRIYN